MNMREEMMLEDDVGGERGFSYCDLFSATVHMSVRHIFGISYG